MEISGKVIEPPPVELPEISLETRPGRLKKLKGRNETGALTDNAKSILQELSVGIGSAKSTGRKNRNKKSSTTKKSRNPNSIFRRKPKKKTNWKRT